MPPSEVVFVMTGARTLSGGIAAVNLNLLTALCEMAAQRRFRLSVESLLEREDDRPTDLPPDVLFRGHAGSKPSLAAATFRSAMRRSLLFYERVGLAAATAPLATAGLLRSVIFAHGWENWRRVRFVDLLSIRGADLVITNSEYTLRRMTGYSPLAGRFRGQACPLGLARTFALAQKPFEPPSGVPPVFVASDGSSTPVGPKALLLVGRMDPTEREKGHDQLLAAFPLVLARHPDAQLVFAGPGDDRTRLEGSARERGVAGSVIFSGRVSSAQLEELYRRCYAFVMPSRQEGFGLVYLEAMNYSKPCLGCREDGAEDVIVHGRTGVLVDDPFDIPALASTVIRLLDEPGTARAMGREGFKRLHERFTAEQFRERFIGIFSAELAR